MKSVELDAVHPDKLKEMVRTVIEQYIDEGQLSALRREEEFARESLAEIAKSVAV